jgi:hypothetical protein
MKVRTQVRPLLRALWRGDTIVKDATVGLLDLRTDTVLLGVNDAEMVDMRGSATVDMCGSVLNVKGLNIEGWPDAPARIR